MVIIEFLQLDMCTIVHIDVDDDEKEAAELAVSSIPALRVLTPDGRLIASTEGAMGADAMADWLAEQFPKAMANAARSTASGRLPVMSVLSVLKDFRSRESTVREVFEAINLQRKSSYTTVLKMLQIMHEKDLVARNEEMRAHVYMAKVKQNETGKQMLNEVMNKVFGGSALKLVQQVLENETTSAEEMMAIREMIQKAELEAKDK